MKEIEKLREMLTEFVACEEVRDRSEIDALEFAIEALTPKDPEAEREHCLDLSVRYRGAMQPQLREMIERERAAARAEVQAQFVAERAELCILRKDLEDWKARHEAVREEARHLLEETQRLEKELITAEKFHALEVAFHKREADAAYDAGFDDGSGLRRK